MISAEDEELQPLVDKLIDDIDWEEYDPPLYRRQWGRVLRSPIKVKDILIFSYLQVSTGN
jgi:hypothetical protein